MARRWALVWAMAALASGCTRGDASPLPASSSSPVSTWKPPAEPAWPELPREDSEAARLVAAEATRTSQAPVDAATIRALRADAAPLVAGEDAMAAVLDGWLRADAKKPAYVLFGTTHDSRAQLDLVRAIAVRMKAPWALALEQFRAAGRWKGAPEIATADDADLAAFAGAKGADEATLWRIRDRQARLDHAAWKYGYLPAMVDLLFSARGASLPVVGCDMPPELHGALTNDGTLSSLRELHCARALRSEALALAGAHQPDGGLDEDDPPPPERFLVMVGQAHAEAGALGRFLPKDARVRTVQLLGGRARGVTDEQEQALAESLVVTDPVLITLAGNVYAAPVTPRRRDVPPGDGQDVLLLPDDVWGGDVDRASDRGASPGPAGDGLPDRNVLVSCDEAATFALGDSRVQVGPKPEWLSARSGRQAYVLAGAARRFVGAVDVPSAGYAEVHFSPKTRAMRIVIHAP